MRKPRNRYLIPLAAAAVLAPAGIAAVPAGAAGTQSVKCIGTGDFCGATVKLPRGGVSNKRIIVRLTDTDFRRVGVRVIPGESKGSFGISRASFRLGGSEYRFTLDAAKGQPNGARVILLFAAGVRA